MDLPELHHPSLVYDSVPHHDKSDSGTGGLHNMESTKTKGMSIQKDFL